MVERDMIDLFQEAVESRLTYGTTQISTPTEEAVFKNGYKIVKSLITEEVKVYNTLVKRDFYDELKPYEVDLLLKEGWVQGTKSLYLQSLKVDLYFLHQDRDLAVAVDDFEKARIISEQIESITNKIKSK
jgi:hypothetical protein